MATLHQVASAKKGDSFIAIGPVTIHRQFNPKTSKHGKLFSSVILKSAGNEMFLTLWEEAAKWKLALGDVTLRGKFSKDEYNGSACLRCDELTEPDGAEEWKPEDVQADLSKPKLKDCIDAGLRAADYLVRKNRPELSEAAFSFAAQAFLQGVRME